MGNWVKPKLMKEKTKQNKTRLKVCKQEEEDWLDLISKGLGLDGGMGEWLRRLDFVAVERGSIWRHGQEISQWERLSAYTVQI
ncbi:hypothetical protein L484_020889 [Morus notabilis]|uniref:Uncharacterized protein n=1 Tax=Morus notabilis TaxID=981085 RepID=W9R2P5_9ROSA|nr:hypothetical protein L484_020889 [Morus notabilis]